jgi:nucleotide-binding universal stress UspA family protein
MESNSLSPGPILVASDFSDAADEAVRQAHLWAMRADCELSALHVMAGAVPMHPLFPQLHEQDATAAVALERQLAERLSERINRCIGRDLDSSSVYVDFGDPYAVIVKKAEQIGASLLVIGGSGATGLKRVFLGSVAEKVVRNAHCSVLVARKVSDGSLVLAATDLSDPSLPAVQAAAGEAKARKMPLVVMYDIDRWRSLVSGLALFGAVPVAPSEAMLAEQKVALTRIVQTQLDRLDVTATVEVTTEANPAAAIVRMADNKHAELLVLASRGRTGLERLALGSVAEEVLRYAHCSVLVVRMQ